MQTFGKYQLVRKLAMGGMAEVFLATASGPHGFEKQLVIKRILPHFAEDPVFTAMFLSEAKLAARLNHPNLVQVFDFGEVDGAYFLAMEYLDGPNLRALGRIARLRNEKLPFALCAKIISLACEGLSYAHNFRDPSTGEAMNLVHRDVSPDNILTSRSGAVKVADFGIAKGSSGHHTQSGVLKGKLAYMPPEQLSRAPLDRRTDVFALGMVLYELLSGEMPFDTTSDVSVMQAIMSADPVPPLADKRADVPLYLQNIVARALEKRADNRYRDCDAFQEDLEQFLRDERAPVHSRQLAEWLHGFEASVPGDVLYRNVPGGPNGTEVLAAPVRPAPAAKPKRPALGKAAWVGGAATLIVAIVAGALFFRGPEPARVTLEPLPSTGGSGGAERPPPPRQEEVTPQPPSPVEPRPEPRVEPVAPPAATVAPLPPALVPVRFRVRPYALVYVDGRAVGETPLPPIKLTPGSHRVRLVNPDLKKEVTLPLQVPRGSSPLFRYVFPE